MKIVASNFHVKTVFQWLQFWIILCLEYHASSSYNWYHNFVKLWYFNISFLSELLNYRISGHYVPEIQVVTCMQGLASHMMRAISSHHFFSHIPQSWKKFKNILTRTFGRCKMSSKWRWGHFSKLAIWPHFQP
jgi:hypothetical protein